MIPSSRPVARTPLHSWNERQGARFIVRDGWQLAAVYSSVERELAAARAGAGLVDISAFAKIGLHGKGVEALARALIGEAAPGPGRVVTIRPGDPVLVCRLTEDSVLLWTAATDAAALETHLLSLSSNLPVVQVNATSAQAGFCLVGPRIEEILRRLTAMRVGSEAFRTGSCAETSVAGVAALLVACGDPSLPALRISVAWDLGEYVWERLLDAGRDCGLVPLGMDALQSLRRMLSNAAVASP
jgi:glycine cleavage system aminomethyltransferase T